MVRATAELGWASFIAYSLQAVAGDKEPGSTLVLNVETTELLVQREQRSQSLQDGVAENTVWESSKGPAGALAKSVQSHMREERGTAQPEREGWVKYFKNIPSSHQPGGRNFLVPRLAGDPVAIISVVGIRKPWR